MEFFDTSDLKSDEIFLRLTKTLDAQPEKRWLPVYYFDICLPDGEKILKRDSVRLMTTNALTPEQAKTYWMPGYGYGLGVKCSIGTPGCSDFGWGGMAGALMSVDPARELSVVYLQHVLFAPNNMERYMIYPLILEELGLADPKGQEEGKENYYV